MRAQLAEERRPLLQAQSNCPQPPNAFAVDSNYAALAERVGAVEAQLAQLSTGNGQLHQGSAALQAQQADAQQTKDAKLAAENRQLREQNAVLQLQLQDAKQNTDVQLATENRQLREQNAALHLQQRDAQQTKDTHVNVLLKTAKALADKVAAAYTRVHDLQGQIISAQQQAVEARAAAAALGDRVQQLEIIIANTKECLGNVAQQWDDGNKVSTNLAFYGWLLKYRIRSMVFYMIVLSFFMSMIFVTSLFQELLKICCCSQHRPSTKGVKHCAAPWTPPTMPMAWTCVRHALRRSRMAGKDAPCRPARWRSPLTAAVRISSAICLQRVVDKSPNTSRHEY